MSTPKCQRCHTKLVWELPPRRPRDNHAARILRARVRSHAMRTFAIRCLWCFKLFCPKCAEKHFAPIQKTEARISRALDQIVAKVVKGLEPQLVTCGTKAAKSSTRVSIPTRG